jgi:DNA replication and repair protein RecF
MFLKNLALLNYRNYESLSINFQKNKTVIVGDNAQGKTNLLEAIYFLSTVSSSRSSIDADFVLWGKEHSLISGTIDKGSGLETNIEIIISPGNSKVLKVNKIKKNSYNEFLGHLVSVSFSISDLLLLRGTPKDRRKWIDNAIMQVYPVYYNRLSLFNKIRQQKQALLKTFHGNFSNLSSVQIDMLDSWNDQLTIAGSNIIYLRQKFLKELAPFIFEKSLSISGNKDTILIAYCSSLGYDFDCNNGELLSVEEIKDIYSRQLTLKTDQEVTKAQAVVGPHRDDIDFIINNKSARSFASQGQQRTIVLSVKLAELDFIKQVIKDNPVLLLDDVLAELDLSRQKYLFDSIGKDYQTIITTTDLDSFDKTWLEDVTIYKVDKGCIIDG